MLDERDQDNHPPSDGWIIASIAILLGVVLVARSLSPRSRELSPPICSRLAESEAAGEGRRSRRAAEIQVRGWKDIVLFAYANISKHRIMALAAGVTYYSLLAIFPAIAALVAIYGLFSDPSTIARHLNQLGGFLPGGAVDVAREQLTRVASKGSQTLGLTFLVGLGVWLWSANAAMKSMFDTLNIVYDEEEKRGFLMLNAISFCFTISGFIFVLAALGCIVVVPVVLNYVGLSDAGDVLLRVGRWPAMYLILAFALAVIYRYGPDRDAPRWRWITWGSAIAALLWLWVSLLFSWYAANFGNFNETYGSLGAVVGFMTWLWISAIVILLGAEIDAAMEDQTNPGILTRPLKPA